MKTPLETMMVAVMRASRFVVVASVFTSLLAGCPKARSGDRDLDFVHALQQKDYADVALDYLDLIEARSDLPAPTREVLDLERCNSYLAWAKSGADGRLAEQRLNQAQTYLKKFLKDHPNHPRAAMAMAYWADGSLERGQRLLAVARRVEDKSKTSGILDEARAAFEDAQERLEKSTQLFRAWLEEGPSAGAKGVASIDRKEVEAGALETRFKTGLANYYLAQTNPDEKDAARTKLLKQAAGHFDAVYQALRGTASDACFFAHLWHARVMEELGDSNSAQDILDELLAGAPETGPTRTPLDAVYTEASALQLRWVAKKSGLQQFVQDANKWLASHKGWVRIPAYQELVLEVAKAQIALAEKAAGDSRNKLVKEAVLALGNVAKSNTEYKEAILLNRQLQKKLGGGDVGVEELMALGDAALADRQLNEAAEHYTQAAKLATDAKDEKRAGEAKQRLNRIRYSQALAVYNSGKLEDALRAASAIAQEPLADPSASHAAALMLSAAVSLYANAADKEKEAAWPRLEKTAEFVIKKWVGLPEADDARITLGQAHLLKGDTPGALAYFKQVAPTSRRYSTVLLIAGQMHWKAYIEERKKDEAERKADIMSAERAKAQQCLQQAVDLLQKEIRVDAGEAASQLIGARLLLAEILMENKQYQEAVKELAPLVAKIKSLQPQTIDTPTFRTFITAVRAYMALGDTKQAAEIALVLVQTAEDKAAFNEVLVNFAKLMRHELRTAEAAVAQTPEVDVTAYKEALKKRDAAHELLIKLIESLLKRRDYALTDLVYLGDLCAAANMNDQAAEQYQSVLKKAQDDPEFAKTAEKAIVRVRAQLVGLLRNQGKLEEAVKQSDELISKNPRSLEPRLTKAYVLEDWAKQDPAKYAAAVAQWTEVRTLLGRLKQKPPEYYTAIYHTAFCLYEEWKNTKDASNLQQAEQVLKTTMVLNSKVLGPDLLAQYQDLLKKVAAAEEEVSKAAAQSKGKSKTAKSTKKK